MLVVKTCARLDLPALQEVGKRTTHLLPDVEALGLSLKSVVIVQQDSWLI